ncbi:MAG: hypothetical protein JSW25_00735 [Thermoplasmata archaeon]|nr:MAG: hypothetical protein JSW25_00735 [Thermoplasmata archaeon]
MSSRESCRTCLYWDHRIEAEVDTHTGYCTVHEMMKADTSHCPSYARRTAASEQQYYNQMYNDGTDYSDSDVDMGGF